MKHKFRSKQYEIKLMDTGDEWGSCHYKARQIWLDKNAKPKRLLDSAIHEGLHACIPDIIEPVVNLAATDIAGLLWKLGYRKIK